MVGISVLGGNAGLEGPYELGIDEISATNEEFSPAKVCSFTCTTGFSHISKSIPIERFEGPQGSYVDLTINSARSHSRTNPIRKSSISFHATNDA